MQQNLLSRIRKPFGNLWRSFFANYDCQFERFLNEEIKNQCNSVLDIGCGFNSPVQHLKPRPKYIVGVDTFEPVIEQSRARHFHDEYVETDVLKIDKYFQPNSFDCVLASDLIEHLPAEDGYKLIGIMEKIARKKVIVYTPNGFLEQEEVYGNPFQRHLSGWSAQQMSNLGFRVMGIQGLKPLRGEMAKIKYWPARFWLAISLLSQPFVVNRPQIAFRILCVKDLSNNF